MILMNIWMTSKWMRVIHPFLYCTCLCNLYKYYGKKYVKYLFWSLWVPSTRGMTLIYSISPLWPIVGSALYESTLPTTIPLHSAFGLLAYHTINCQHNWYNSTHSPIAKWTVAQKQGVFFPATHIVGFFGQKTRCVFSRQQYCRFFLRGKYFNSAGISFFSLKIKGSIQREDSNHPPPLSSVRHICLPTVLSPVKSWYLIRDCLPT